MPVCIRSVAVAAVVLMVSCGGLHAQQYPHVVTTDPLTPPQQQKKFHLPPGFAIELVAAEPQIAKPLNLNFDAQGRLYVTQTIEYPHPPPDRPGRDALLRLSDADGDGRYESTETLLDGLVIPIGVTPYGEDAIVFSIPNIIRGHDSDGDGRLDRRQVLFGPFGFADTHGLNNGFTRWIDGWIYACHGFRNTSAVAGDDAQSLSMTSGNTYRFRADGSHIERFTHGQVNPFGLCFDPLGNAYTADCHSKPMYQLLRGAYYPSFGQPHDGLGFGPTLIEHSHGSTGIGGIAYYAADRFPPEYRDTIFIANPITHRINHDRLEARGATYRGVEVPDFLVCDDPWFRPVDLQLGPDGALYVADFYNRIIGHYEVPLDHPGRDRRRGRIWRIVYQAENRRPTASGAATDLTALTLRQLWDRLGDANLTLRTLATNEIVDRFGGEAVAGLREWIAGQSTATQRAHGLWILHRLDALDDALLIRLAEDEDRLVRVHLARMLAERSNWKSTSLDLHQLAVNLLADRDPHVRRAAADALGRHPRGDQIAPLLRLWTDTPADDTHLTHVVRMALRDHLRDPSAYSLVQPQFDGDADALRRLAEVSLGVRSAASAEFVLSQLGGQPALWNKHLDWVHYAARYLKKDRLPALVQRFETIQQAGETDNVVLLLTVGRAFAERGERLPVRLRDRAAELAMQQIGGSDQARALQGMELARQLRLSGVYDLSARIAAAGERPVNVRLAALQTCIAVRPTAATELLAPLLADASQPPLVRRKAAELLGAGNRPQNLAVLARQLETAHFSLATVIATGLARTSPGAEMLLESVAQGKAAPRLLQQRIVQRTLSAAGVENLEQRLAKLTAGLPPADEAINQVIAQRKRGFFNARRHHAVGAVVFKKNCAACHQLGGQGNKVGPQLDGIGNRGIDRLLEDILDPSRNVDPAFRSTTIETTGGQVLSGLVTGQEGQVVLLVDNQGQQRRIALSSIERRRISPLSAMPANVTELVKGDDFYHLLGYLLSQRQEVNGQ